MRRRASIFAFAFFACVFVCAPCVSAQGENSSSNSSQDQAQADKKASQQAKKAKQKRDKDLYNELDSQYKKWLNEDVVYIISPEERSAFLHLSTNEEREQFIEHSGSAAIPIRTRPTTPLKKSTTAASPMPTSISRRASRAGKPIAAAFTSCGALRTKSTRTRRAAATIVPRSEGGGETSTYPFEDWRYRYLEGIGENVELEFVDPTMTGEYNSPWIPAKRTRCSTFPAPV